jgi:AraC family transcriptional regulator
MNKTCTKDNYVMRINTIVEYINNHLDEDMDLKKLAEMSHFSIYHFHRIFRGFTHETLAAYITRNRVERAAYMLRYTNLSIEAIAYNVGFEFHSSLSRAFKQFYNISPAAYRNNRDYSIIERVKKEPEVNTNLIYPRLVKLECKNVIYIHLIGAYNVLNHPKIWEQLQAYAKEQNIYPNEVEYIGIYHDDISVTETDKLRSDICLSINKPVKACGKIGVKTIPRGKYAVFLYEGPFNSMSAIYDAIFANWLPNSGYEVRDLPLYEKYLTDPSKTGIDKLKTEVYLPIGG